LWYVTRRGAGSAVLPTTAPSSRLSDIHTTGASADTTRMGRCSAAERAFSSICPPHSPRLGEATFSQYAPNSASCSSNPKYGAKSPAFLRMKSAAMIRRALWSKHSTDLSELVLETKLSWSASALYRVSQTLTSIKHDHKATVSTTLPVQTVSVRLNRLHLQCFGFQLVIYLFQFDFSCTRSRIFFLDL
jgi:hypothetical protein